MINKLKDFDGFNITFNTGEDCNLACTYCYEISKNRSKLSFEDAKKFIDLMLETDDPIGVKGTDNEWVLNQGLILDFIGGDSLMHPKLVDQILEYFVYKAFKMNHRWQHRWRASITSNGTLFKHKEVRDLINKWNKSISLTVSIDGCPELHDLNRIYPNGAGSIKDIEEYWFWFRSLYPTAGTKSTLSKQSIPYIFESLKYMHEKLFINHVNQNFIFEDMELEKEDLEEYDRQMHKCVNYTLQHKDQLYWSMIDKDMVASSCSYKENCKINPDTGWCGSGMMPALSPNGKIYPCFRFLPHTQEKELSDMSVGDVNNGFTNSKVFNQIRSYTREKISPEKCKECPIESGCAWCIAGAFAENGKPFRQTYICEIQKIRDKWAKIYWDAFNKGIKNV